MGRKHLTHSQQLDRWEKSINKTIQNTKNTKNRIEKLKHLIVEEEEHILSNENLKINIRKGERIENR